MEENNHTLADEIFFSSKVYCLLVFDFDSSYGKVTPIPVPDN